MIADHSHQQTKVRVSKIKTLCCLHPIVRRLEILCGYPYWILIPWLQPWNTWSRTLVKRIQKRVVITVAHLDLRHFQYSQYVSRLFKQVFLLSLQDLMRLIKWSEQSNLPRELAYWSCHILWSNPQIPDINSWLFYWTWWEVNIMHVVSSICPKGTTRLW